MLPSFYTLRASALAAVLALAPVALHAQDIPKDQRPLLLATAKAKYYNLFTAGVQGFSCDVAIDWNSLFRAVSGADLPADNPFLVYLQNIHVSFRDALKESATIEWTPTGTPPPDKEAAVKQITAGVRQMLEGFFSAWNPSLNGTLISSAPTSFAQTPTGYTIGDTTKDGQSSLLTLNKDMLIQHLGGSTDQVSSEMDTAFTDSPKGLLLTQLTAVVRQPLTAPPVNMVMTTTYATTDGAQIPATLHVEMPNVMKLSMNFVKCTVQRQPESKTIHGKALPPPNPDGDFGYPPNGAWTHP